MDCLIGMKDIPDKSVDCIICDLPYGVLNKNNPNAQWDFIIPLDKLWEQYERIIKDNGAIILFGQGMFSARVMMSNPELWRYNLIWKKGNRSTGFLNANRMPLRCHEDIMVFYKQLPTYNPQFVKGAVNHSRGYITGKQTNQCYGDFDQTKRKENFSGMKFPISVIDIDKEHDNEQFHPTQKPVDLIEWLIKTYTNEGDLVLDNCMGSGTTAIAAMNTNRNFIGFEIEKKYFDIANRRILENTCVKLF